MKFRSKWTRMVSLLTVCALIVSVFTVSGQKAEAAVSASSASFTDVAKTHWAAKHISKLALQGIVKGAATGKFMPSDNVSQQDAVIMAIRFLGKESEVEANEAVVFASGFEVSEYAKGYINLAFKLGLLIPDEEYNRLPVDPKKTWGTTSASREWITKLIVKSIDKKSLAEELDATASTFADASSIGNDYLGYVNAGVSLGLIKGVSDNKFDPSGLITRASIATIFSRAESQFPVDYAGQDSGIATKLTSDGITLFQENSDKSYTITSDTLIYRYDSEQLSSLDKLSLYTDFLLVADSSGNVLYLEQLKDEKHVETVSGTVDRVIPGSSIIWIWVNDEPIKVSYDSNLIVKDTSGNELKISDLVQDSEVTITRDTYRTNPLAVEIAVKSAPVNKTVEGVVSEVKVASNSLKLLYTANDASESFIVSPTVDVIYQGTISEAGLSSVKVGDNVKVEVKDSIVTKITVQSTTSAATITGTFQNASMTNLTINYMLNGKLEAKFMTDDVTVVIDGLTGATVSDLQQGDEIEISVNSVQKVTSIKALNRTIKVLNGATVLNYDADYNALQVRDALTNTTVSVDLTEATRITYNGTSMTLTSAEAMLVKNRKVSVGYTNGRAVFIEFVYQYSGTVLSVNATTKQLKLDLTNGSTVTMPLQYDSVELQGKSTATIADVKVGDTVTGILNTEQDKFITIKIHKGLQYEVTSVNTSGKKVTLKAIDGTTTTFDVSNWKLYNDGGESIAIGALAAGNVVNVNYTGNTADSLSVVSVRIGKVTAVATNKVTVTDYAGATFTVELGDSYTVIKDGVKLTTAAVLAAGDRVEVRKDATGQAQITILTGVSKLFWKYDSATNSLYVKRESLTDASYIYSVTSATKITQGTSSIVLTSLVEDNSVLLYFYQGQLIEIVKVS
ncbi:uncharacterized DUF497 family protein/uncharacterized protein YjhX (UPF0386 family) [Paenibacillus phyllosphaerae]|uniref:Uncharacterized DUF497 family protein/uncharacterized protein YjhX (UPF0386 family) n=1 Tax=Paenibacillus phyllosphaerae TaxID=274593 RepID=A0A7W5AX95_9BACL|nr:S-layer homology domain-containing protein [Paenibacillus phyllosphaerae]MBB3110438.1 uncharacterized DUF497 family protein/uncharacterized protein YjhX (UPF0386 family) [Paenibacillus phyllosphaerae]